MEQSNTNLKDRPKIMDNILVDIGLTPLVRLNQIPKAENVKCEILVKCEYLNPGGSVKDRIALRMIEDAEKYKRIKPGDTLIEPTSGNMSIAVARAAAVKGYRCKFVVSEEIDIEKVNVLRALGADIVHAPTSEYCSSLDSNFYKAYVLKKELPDAHILDQYTNKSNLLAHYDGTAEEILSACDERLDMVVAGAHTGGTLAGLARNIKQKCPNCLVVGVYSNNKDGPTYSDIKKKRGDFVPKVPGRRDVDHWYKTTEKESFAMARRLIQEEGLLCGGSSGSAVHAAIRAARDYNLQATARVVVILPDSLSNNMTKFLSGEWMDDGNNQSNYRQKEF